MINGSQNYAVRELRDTVALYPRHIRRIRQIFSPVRLNREQGMGDMLRLIEMDWSDTRVLFCRAMALGIDAGLTDGALREVLKFVVKEYNDWITGSIEADRDAVRLAHFVNVLISQLLLNPEIDAIADRVSVDYDDDPERKRRVVYEIIVSDVIDQLLRDSHVQKSAYCTRHHHY